MTFNQSINNSAIVGFISPDGWFFGLSVGILWSLKEIFTCHSKPFISVLGGANEWEIALEMWESSVAEQKKWMFHKPGGPS